MQRKSGAVSISLQMKTVDDDDTHHLQQRRRLQRAREAIAQRQSSDTQTYSVQQW